MARSYNHKTIERKWQNYWRINDINKQQAKTGRPKCYVLDMFPYISGAGLHVGHPRGYIATDIYSRFKRMFGYSILHPIGWDSFGLPAENYAIKHKIHPGTAVSKNIKRFKKQLGLIGFNYDWNREINTADPQYYKWTQWIFLQLYKKGLVYESYEPINWCPSCQTGLANEDLEDGRCERCGSVVEKKPIRQWVLKIRNYADRLLKDLDKLNWPESVKESQRNWIGRSEGVNFKCRIKDLGIEVEMYNSVPQSYHAETFTVIAPEHPLVETLVKGTKNEKKVLAFIEKIKQKKLSKRFDLENDLEGIFTGRFIESFADTGRNLPIWIASYVLVDYGTGIVNASAHDERDFLFAKKYNIPLHPVTFPKDPALAKRIKNLEEPYCRDPEGILTEPEIFKGRKWLEVREDIIKHIEKNNLGKKAVNYKLRDWVFSRQRYWGEPIPIIHCQKCGVVPVPEKDLPVKLPMVKAYKPTGTGESPLANMSQWVNVKCPKCGGSGKRETNTMPQWAGSSWYYLRYIDPKNDRALVDKKKDHYWSPVDLYVGGTEHVARHMIYARFWHKFLYDIKVVNYPEPFSNYRYQGLVLASDGRKMSKRFNNIINPDDIVKTYGADTLRVYEMFMGPFNQTIAWSTESMIGSRRFLEKVWRLQDKLIPNANDHKNETLIHQTIKKVTDDIESFSFNTAISALMILTNVFDKEKKIGKKNYKILLQLLAPFAPHLTEELWFLISRQLKKTIHSTIWPKYNPQKLVAAEIKIMVQINGKVRGSLISSLGVQETILRQKALLLPTVKKHLKAKKINRVIYVKNRLINIVTD